LIAHWDEVADDLAQAAGAIDVSVRRIQLAPGDSTQLPHRQTEDVLFVVAGGTDDLRAGDCVVYPLPHEPATLRASDEGLTALLFATPAALPPFHSGETARPRTINVADAESEYEGEVGRWVRLARQAGATYAGVNYGRLESGHEGAEPHCHSADEELFVILEGGGTLDLWPAPVRARDTQREQHQVRAGHVISRPPSTGVAHSFVAGPEGMTFLVYGTRRPNDVCYYPRSGSLYFRGLGFETRLEPLEPED
jgi:uncharacterized cupin superfamily protein